MTQAGGKTPPVCVYAWYLWNSERCRSVWVMPAQLFKKNKQELLRFTHFTDAGHCVRGWSEREGQPQLRRQDIDHVRHEAPDVVGKNLGCTLRHPVPYGRRDPQVLEDGWVYTRTNAFYLGLRSE